MIDIIIQNNPLQLETGPGCFSPHAVDAGTLHMLAHADIQPGEAVLDLGCGYGVVGVYAAKITDPALVYMTDIDSVPLAYARQNVERNNVSGVHILRGDAYEAIDRAGFDIILSNPPYHTDFAVAKAFIEKGFNRLRIGGRMLMVAKRRDWYRNKLIAVFGGVKEYQADGYYVWIAEKRDRHYAGAMKKQNGQGRRRG